MAALHPIALRFRKLARFADPTGFDGGIRRPPVGSGVAEGVGCSQLGSVLVGREFEFEAPGPVDPTRLRRRNRLVDLKNQIDFRSFPTFQVSRSSVTVTDFNLVYSG